MKSAFPQTTTKITEKNPVDLNAVKPKCKNQKTSLIKQLKCKTRSKGEIKMRFYATFVLEGCQRYSTKNAIYSSDSRH